MRITDTYYLVLAAILFSIASDRSSSTIFATSLIRKSLPEPQSTGS